MAEQQDGQVPAPRRPASRLRRPAVPPLPEAADGDADAPRVADLSALLADIDALRTTLSTDLSLAAAALEAGADDLAGELVSGDLEAVRAFEARSLAHLAALEAERPVAEPEPVETTVATATPLRRRRVLQAAPLLAAAAAAAALFAGLVPTDTVAPTGTASLDDLAEANYSFAALSQLAEAGASPDDLREAAVEMNDDLEALLEDASQDPAAAQQALVLLEMGSEVLSRQDDAGALDEVLARTRELREELLLTLLPKVPGTLRPVAPTKAGTPLVTVTLRPVRPQPPRPTTSPSVSPRPASPRPAASPTVPPPAPQPTTSPPATSPAPSPGTGNPLPGAGVGL